MLDFLNFKFVDFLDIVLVGLMLYYIYRLLKGTVAISIFLGIVIIFVIWKLTVIVKMELVSSILGQFINVGFFASRKSASSSWYWALPMSSRVKTYLRNFL